MNKISNLNKGRNLPWNGTTLPKNVIPYPRPGHKSFSRTLHTLVIIILSKSLNFLKLQLFLCKINISNIFLKLLGIFEGNKQENVLSVIFSICRMQRVIYYWLKLSIYYIFLRFSNTLKNTSMRHQAHDSTGTAV